MNVPEKITKQLAEHLQADLRTPHEGLSLHMGCKEIVKFSFVDGNLEIEFFTGNSNRTLVLMPREWKKS